MSTCRGRNSAIIFFTFSQSGSTPKGRNLILQEQALFQSRSCFRRVVLSREANRKSLKLFPFVKMVEITKKREII